MAAQLLLNGGESIGDLAHLEREECASAGCIGNALERFVALALHATDVGADRVDDDLGALCHFDGFLARHVTVVVFAIAQQDDRAANGSSLLMLEQFVAARIVKRVEHRSSTARA